MGAEQSKGEDQNTIEQVLQKFQQQEKLNHPSFGDIQVLKDKSSDNQVGLKEFNLTDESEFTKTIEKFKPKLALDNPNLIKLHNCIQNKESQFCSTFFKVYLVFEYVKNTLEQEVQERSKDQKQPFSEEEMWNILTSCVQGAHFLYQNKLNHNNIRPSTIYITSNGIVKLADPTLFSQQGLYPAALSSPNNVPQGIYISPELLNDMYQQQYNPVYNQQKADVFSIGMCMLHAALLEPLDDLYDYKTFQINEAYLHERLNQVRENYGDLLYQYLYHMLNFNADDRQDIAYFYQQINLQQEYAETATFQQAETTAPQAQKQGEYVITQASVTKSPERPYQPYEVITTKTVKTSTIPPKEEEVVKRSAANPNYGQVQVQIQQQPQIVIQKMSNQPTGYSSAGMFKDSEDKGSTITFIPKDQHSKNAIPDENIGNAIGGGDTYYQQQSVDVQPQITSTTNNYVLPQTSTYVTQTYTNPPLNQDYTSKYTSPITTTTVTYTNPTVNIAPYTPLTQYSSSVAPATSTSKYSSTFLPTNTYELQKGTEVSTANTGAGYYVSTKEQQYQPAAQTTITTNSQFTSDLSKPYQTTSYGLKENNFSYIPGPTANNYGTSTGLSSTTTNVVVQSAQTTPASTVNQATTSSNTQPVVTKQSIVNTTIPAGTTSSYTATNTYVSPVLSNILKKDESIEEAIKRSAPPPLKNELISSPYSAQVASNSGSNFYAPSITTTLTQPPVQTNITSTAGTTTTTTTTIVNNNNPITTVTTSNAGYDPYKPSDEIEAILAKYRNSKETMSQLGLSSNTADIKISNNSVDVPQNNTNLAAVNTYTTTTTTTNVGNNTVTPSYQAYTPSQTYTTNISNIGGNYEISKPIESLNNQFQGLNINQNSNIQVSQVQSQYTAQFNPSQIQSTYQTSAIGTSNLGTTNPYTQTYNIQQSFGQSQPQSYQQETQLVNDYQTEEKEYVIENYSNNSKYEGEKLNGMRHGRGKFYYQDGGLFDGEWRENKMHGKGILSYASGKPAYDGDWVDDKFEGFGILYNENPAPLNQPYDFSDFDNVEEYWTKYEGQFKDDNKEGYGTLFLSNGEKFVGTFFKDFVNGEGTFYTLNGDVLQGQWHQNKFIA
ncbi:hypothetical protein ABPG74_001846 [Tetrahymena malaccensis]